MIVDLRSVDIPSPCDPMDHLLCSQEQLDGILDGLEAAPADASLAILNPMIPPSSAFGRPKTTALTHDIDGFSSYARLAWALLHVLYQDRPLAKDKMWTLRHLLALSVYADDHMKLPSAKNAVFRGVTQPVLQDLLSKVQQVATYLLSAFSFGAMAATDDWHANVVDTTLNNTVTKGGDVARFVQDNVKTAARDDNIRDARILHEILQHLLRGCSAKEADHWLRLARSIEKTGD